MEPPGIKPLVENTHSKTPSAPAVTPRLRASWLAGLLAAVMLAPPANATRIAEPDTVFYGRIVTRTVRGEFPIRQGELRWVIRTAVPESRERELVARLEPLADGLYSYRLGVPHQLLAFDLNVSPRFLPLTSAGAQLQHVRITVDGYPAFIIPPAIDSFTAQQADRASTHRVDLEVPALSLDSDGDGLPDWWEDQHGLDKWNPNDAGSGPDPGSDPENPPVNGGGITFAQWREHHFPGATGSIEAFAASDPDQDGLVNLLEYAFDLNPTFSDAAQAIERRPHAVIQEGLISVVFTKRLDALDLDYKVEVSEDLISWSEQPEELQEMTSLAVDAPPGRVIIQDNLSGEGMPHRFLRVRIGLKP